MASADRASPPARDGRLRSRKDFQAVYSQGTAVRGALAVLIYYPNGLGETRRAFVASRKVGGAVVRNRAKRLLREAFRALRGEVDVDGLDLVIIARPPCGKADIRIMTAALTGLYKLAGRWKGPTS